jgi:hypothetical protein
MRFILTFEDVQISAVICDRRMKGIPRVAGIFEQSVSEARVHEKDVFGRMAASTTLCKQGSMRRGDMVSRRFRRKYDK